MRPSVPARLTSAAGVAALLTACVPLPGGRTLSRRTVAGMQGENTLVAQDGATCQVARDTYERTKVGDERTCACKDGAPDGGGRRVPSVRPERGWRSAQTGQR